jgi:DNA-binding protein H-NS
MRDLQNLETVSIEQLWRLHEKIAAALATKINDERELLERRLAMLSRPATRTRRAYPPVLPKFVNPANPRERWSGRGKRPRWVTKQLDAGRSLKDMRI